MDTSIAGILMLDGATNGAVYALMALATVLVFAVTRVIFIPQGEFVAYGALTLAMLQLGKMPGTAWLMLALAVLAAVLDGTLQPGKVFDQTLPLDQVATAYQAMDERTAIKSMLTV